MEKPPRMCPFTVLDLEVVRDWNPQKYTFNIIAEKPISEWHNCKSGKVK